jgi:formate dehydrogenase subunit gamma
MSDAQAVTALDANQLQVVQAELARGKTRPGPLLEVLLAIQERLGFVPPAAVPVIADGLNLSRAEVHGVITFYHYIRQRPAGRHVVQLCRAEACQAMGANNLAQHAKRQLGADFHATSPDGAVTLEAVYCLGNCARAPAMLVDGELHGCVTAQRFDAVIKELAGRS